MTDPQIIEELAAEQSMFVQTAQAATTDGTTLTLKGVTPSTLREAPRARGVLVKRSPAHRPSDG